MTIARAVLSVAVLLLPASSMAGEAAKTLKGEVLDLSCYLAHDGQGPKHAKCAKQCALKGTPVGLLTGDGTVYLLLASHGKEKALDAAKGLAGEQAQVSGSVAKKSGFTAFLVEKAEKAQ